MHIISRSLRENQARLLSVSGLGAASRGLFRVLIRFKGESRTEETEAMKVLGIAALALLLAAPLGTAKADPGKDKNDHSRGGREHSQHWDGNRDRDKRHSRNWDRDRHHRGYWGWNRGGYGSSFPYRYGYGR